MPATDLSEVQRQVQGNILRGYGFKFRCVRHLVLPVADGSQARTFLGQMVNGDRSTPEVTSGEMAPDRAGMDWYLNVGITYRGLEALGVPAHHLASFPPEFIEGMAARAPRLGDYGESDPTHWRDEFRHPESVHLIVTIHGQQFTDIEPIAEQVLGAAGGRAFELLPGRPPVAHVRWRVPTPVALGLNGSFNAFRVLRQDVAGFERFLADHAARLGWTPDLVAAMLCGRWRNGAPLSLAPSQAAADALVASAQGRNQLNDFDFLDDPDGTGCPIGSHIRRSNPRRAHIVQRAANRSRPLVRRGIPYGEPFVASEPARSFRRAEAPIASCRAGRH